MMMTGILFCDLLKRLKLPESRARLVRHNQDIAVEYAFGRKFFEHAVTYQAAKLNPFKNAEVAYHFLPGPVLKNGDQTALFVGAHRIGDEWLFESGYRLPPMHCDHERCYRPLPADRAFELCRLDEIDHLREKVLVRWGPPSAARAWSQWVDGSNKEIVELRLTAREAEFPGYSNVHCNLDEVLALPPSWQQALRAISGVYILVCPDTGQQYVGSAYGENGIWARWCVYAVTGHGGNKVLKELGPKNFRMSILEILPSEATSNEVIARESKWKTKLGTRAHGLNAN